MIEELESLVNEGYVSRRKHPTLDLYILNYTPKTQYEGFWNDTTEQCRGLIVDGEGRVVSRCLRKFFNYKEVSEDVSLRLARNISFKAFDKLDGSLGITYWDAGRPCIATRGSFTSEQAVRANDMLGRLYHGVTMDPDVTYLFEVIYPENRICLDYGGAEDLVLLAAINSETAEEVDPGPLPFPRPEVFDLGSDFDRISALNLENREGFVVRFDDGFRFKIKFDEYVALHSAIFSISTKTVWEFLKSNNALPLDRLPDEIYDWVNNVEREIRRDYAAVEAKSAEIFSSINHLARKDFAAAALDYGCSSVLFKMLDGRPYEDQIWKMVEPEYSTPRHEKIQEDS
jgi:RNA ligase